MWAELRQEARQRERQEGSTSQLIGRSRVTPPVWHTQRQKNQAMISKTQIFLQLCVCVCVFSGGRVGLGVCERDLRNSVKSLKKKILNQSDC